MIGDAIKLLLMGLLVLPTATLLSSLPSGQATPEGGGTPRFAINAGGDQEYPWFEATVAPGEAVDLTAEIRNIGQVDVTVRSYVTNAHTALNGGFVAGDHDEDLGDPARWIDYPQALHDVPAGGRQEIPFTVRVPEGTAPGFYVAALVAQTPEPFDLPGSTMFDQIVRSAASVEVTVPGNPVASMELGAPQVTQSESAWHIEVPVVNMGTTRLLPKGEMTVTSREGQAVAQSQVEMRSVYSGTETMLQVSLPAHLSPGDYRVSLELTDPSTGAHAELDDVQVQFTEIVATPLPDAEPTFHVEGAGVTPSGDPVQYANVAATIVNNGEAIPTANVMLTVMRDGEEVERYPLAQNQALPQGATEFSQRYVPVDGWQEGTYTFEVQIAATIGGTETILATIDIEDQITVP